MSEHTLKAASDSQRFISRKHQAREKKRYVKAILLLLLAVLAGVAIGVGGTLLFIRDKFHRRPPKADAVAQMVVGRMRESVTMNPDEERRLTAIVDERMREVDAMRRSSFDSFRDIMERMNEQITEVLGPERTAKWEVDKEKFFGKRARPPKKDGDHPKPPKPPKPHE